MTSRRTEYIAAVKALVGVDVKTKDILPQDTTIGGFDNIASGLGVSPAFVEHYVESARVIAKQAVGDISSGGLQPLFRDDANSFLQIKGPYNPTGISTLSRSLIYVCDPR